MSREILLTVPTGPTAVSAAAMGEGTTVPADDRPPDAADAILDCAPLSVWATKEAAMAGLDPPLPEDSRQFEFLNTCGWELLDMR
ncbi:MAG: hypothetical protein JO023_18675 [Chloroflexi bacterium]|nr:hypothetical protein [Chloroflexota bacterium]